MGDSNNVTGARIFAVLGAGSWGTALAIQLARAGAEVRLWAHDAARAAAIAKTRVNEAYLPDYELPPSITATGDLHAALSGSTNVLIVVPSHAFRDCLKMLVSAGLDTQRLAWATKGFELETGRLPHQVAAEILDSRSTGAVLSGPTFAAEVAAGLPSALTIASADIDYANRLALDIATDTFRAYTSTDVIGVEVGGATKNVFAIGAGLCDGLGFGANTRIALITRGLAEMTRLGMELGARRETFMGLAGIGDLVLTCTDDQSRNRRFGLALAQGRGAQEAMQEIGQVVEGYFAARAVREVAVAHGVDMPIVEQIYRVLYEGLSPHDGARELMQRPLSAELQET
jgi:glycerol-3-phosphate dehydrogenase (NAD(P)+)